MFLEVQPIRFVLPLILGNQHFAKAGIGDLAVDSTSRLTAGNHLGPGLPGHDHSSVESPEWENAT